MLFTTRCEILCDAHIKSAPWVLEDVTPKHKNPPAVGFEPTTNRLTADRSTTELRWNGLNRAPYDAERITRRNPQSVNPAAARLYH